MGRGENDRFVSLSTAGHQALAYLVMAKETLGDDWLTPDLFRFGASTLANDILMQIANRRRQLPERRLLLAALVALGAGAFLAGCGLVLLDLRSNLQNVLLLFDGERRFLDLLDHLPGA
jgi:hypothetical protein